MSIKGIHYEALSKSQQTEICYLIGEWYMHWKYKITDHDTHRLGFAKEELKELICEKMGVDTDGNA